MKFFKDEKKRVRKIDESGGRPDSKSMKIENAYKEGNHENFGMQRMKSLDVELEMPKNSEEKYRKEFIQSVYDFLLENRSKIGMPKKLVAKYYWDTTDKEFLIMLIKPGNKNESFGNPNVIIERMNKLGWKVGRNFKEFYEPFENVYYLEFKRK